MLPPGSKRLEEARETRRKQIVQGDLPALLRPYEGPTERAIIRRITVLREQFTERERTSEVSSRAEYRMKLALGERVSDFAEQQVAPIIAKGKTSAGTTFLIRARMGKASPGSCKHKVNVEIRDRNGSGNGGSLCLREDARPDPPETVRDLCRRSNS